MIHANDNEDWLPPNNPSQLRSKYAISNPTVHLGECLEAMKVMPSNPGLPLHQIVIWDRKSGFNFNQSFYLPSHEWVMIFAKPAFRLNSKAASGAKNIWRIADERNNSHPAPFPVELPMTAIETTTAQVILDPFCGSGTTGVACARLGRQFIGIQLEPKFHQMAIDRTAAEFPIAA